MASAGSVALPVTVIWVPSSLVPVKVVIEAEAEKQQAIKIAEGQAEATLAKMTAEAKGLQSILDGKAVSVQEFQTIAELPSREVLISKLLYLMQYPVSGLAVALEQIRKQKEGAA